MTRDDDVRTHRQALLHAGEPGDRALARFVGEHGVSEAVERLRAGQGPGRDGRHSARLLAADLDREKAAAEQLGARLLVPGDRDWPSGLDDLARTGAPAYAVWARGGGVFDADGPRAVAVVGARASTAYGEHVATEVAAGLADEGWWVVSGAAYGIDAAAHRACLAVGGVTVAVLAGGVDRPYPRGHASLLERVAVDGLVLSELPIGEHPTRARFLDRNRLIAALSCGVVAVEMGRRSGAANTLEHARRIGRPAMVVPGPVTSALSAGCHDALRDRTAEIVCDAGDVLRLVAPIGDYVEPVRRGGERGTDHLDRDALSVYESLPTRGRVPLAAVPGSSRLPDAVVADALRTLVVAGLVEVVDGQVARAGP